MVMIDISSFFVVKYYTFNVLRKLSHAQLRKSAILGALEQSNLFGPSNKVLCLKKLVIKSGVRFLILFVLVDAILQKVVYFKNKSGTGVVFLALCLYLMVIIDNSSLFCLYIFVLEDLAFFPTVNSMESGKAFIKIQRHKRNQS